QIVSGEFAETQEPAIAGNRIKAHAAAKLFEKLIVGVGHGVGQVHILAAADFQHRVARDYIFFERGKSDGGLDGGARNGAVGVYEFLIDDGKNTPGVGIDGNHRTVVTAKSFDGGGANDGVIVAGDVAQSRVNALFANVMMTRRASRLDGGFGKAWRSTRRRRADATRGKEHCESGFSEPGE